MSVSVPLPCCEPPSSCSPAPLNQSLPQGWWQRCLWLTSLEWPGGCWCPVPWGLVLPRGPCISPRSLVVPNPVAGEVAGVLPLALFNLPASPHCSLWCRHLSFRAPPGPGRAAPALCSGEGKKNPAGGGSWDRPLPPRLSAPASPGPFCTVGPQGGSRVLAVLCWARPVSISDSVIREYLIFLLPPR